MCNASLTHPPTHPHPPSSLKVDNIIPSRGPYRTCESVYLSADPTTYRLRSIEYPALVPDLPVDIVLGTMSFNELNLK